MSDTKTPETDWVIKNCNGWHHVPAEKARELEIERNASIDERDKLKADAAAMRVLLKACVEFGVEHYATCPEDDTCDCEHIKGIDAALSGDAGRELLAELQRLRAQHEFSDGQAAHYARLCDTKDAELNSMREDLAKAQSQCAAKDEALKSAKAFVNFQLGWIGNTELQRQVELALSPDCGRDYVHRSDVESIIADVSHLRNEVDCRIDHGAQHGGHLDYVKLCLTQIIDAHR